MGWGRNLELGFGDSSLLCTSGVPWEGVPGSHPLLQAGSTAGPGLCCPTGKEPWAGPGNPTLERLCSFPWISTLPAPAAPNPWDVPGAGMGLGKALGSVWMLLIQQPAGILDNNWKILCPFQRFPRVVPGGTQLLRVPGGI